ncbi:alpha/beta fold hydrolase [Nostocoides sp. F2B08]|uniref:alpha/beta hydrolase n=1 Tax=Nostocoides sp. F2B08 TaxID=2653936 RepID=UPI001263BB9E|nr:alpha/beta fold hydrolase [Tetrasphaera sp. F2B08]KAB7742388.1 alpha/beta fold hydrolase [Tetrasphaera sp. F2B08]
MRWGTAGRAAAGGVLGSAVLGGLASLGAASYFARAVLTPDGEGPTDHVVHDLDAESVTLSRTAESEVPGRYGLWDEERTAHLRMGQILETTDSDVTREVLGLDFGDFRPGPARFNQYFYAQPPDEALGLSTEHVTVEAEIGDLPAWFVPAGDGGDRWAVLVHGRGALRFECVRAVRALHDAGLNVLVPAYRNDADAPHGLDGRYTLGLSEWRDVEDAVRYALDRGAGTVTLGGWSMGGAICMQVLAQSDLAPLVDGVFLDCPVLDWGHVLRHHAHVNNLPTPVALLARTVMGSDSLRWLAGVSETVDVAQTDWVTRAEELTHPLLVMHSTADDFVPIGPSRAVAVARPDLVTYEEWDVARHCKLWNTDSERWERAVTEFVSRPG